jgi:hypothetical protein
MAASKKAKGKGARTTSARAPARRTKKPAAKAAKATKKPEVTAQLPVPMATFVF